MNKTFEYSGLHFQPVGTMNKTYTVMLTELQSSSELGMCAFRGSAMRFYTYETFRTTADYVDPKANIFLCIETQKMYVPFVNELMEYTGKVTKK